MRRGPLLLLVALAALVAAPSAAGAKDPGRWVVTGATSVPNDYFQGLTSNPADTSVYFTGFFQGLWKTNPRLAAWPACRWRSRRPWRPPRATTTSAIPPG